MWLPQSGLENYFVLPVPLKLAVPTSVLRVLQQVLKLRVQYQICCCGCFCRGGAVIVCFCCVAASRFTLACAAARNEGELDDCRVHGVAQHQAREPTAAPDQ